MTETFAIKTLYLGEAPRNGGAASSEAWKAFGYDLDGKATTATSTDVCARVDNAPAFDQVDGDNGIDNAFGSAILPILQTAAGLTQPSLVATQQIAAGRITIQLQVTGFDDTPDQTGASLPGQLFPSGSYDTAGMVPAFDLTTDWPVESQWLRDPTDLTRGSQLQFNGYVMNGTYVSSPFSPGAGSNLVVTIFFGDVPIELPIHHAVLTFNHGQTTYGQDGTPTGITADPAMATDGTIAGIIKTTDLVSIFQSIAGRISLSLCGNAFDGVVTELEQASDMLDDGTNVPGATCDAISIGVGFDAVEIRNPDRIAVAPSPSPDPCDAGTDR